MWSSEFDRLEYWLNTVPRPNRDVILVLTKGGMVISASFVRLTAAYQPASSRFFDQVNFDECVRQCSEYDRTEPIWMEISFG